MANPLLKPTWIEGDDEEPEEVVFIEYHGDRPFTVITRGGNRESTYDFEYCQRWNRLYWNESGGSPAKPIPLYPFSDPSPPLVKLWLADGVGLADGRQYDEPTRTYPPLPREALSELGYELLAEPLVCGRVYHPATGEHEDMRNPFDVADEAPCIYCHFCEDWLPEDGDELCEHLTWCDACGSWVYRFCVPQDNIHAIPVIHPKPGNTERWTPRERRRRR